MAKDYFIMDGRAKTSLSDYPNERALILEVCDSLEEARKRKKEWDDACIVDGNTGKILWEEEKDDNNCEAGQAIIARSVALKNAEKGVD